MFNEEWPVSKIVLKKNLVTQEYKVMRTINTLVYDIGDKLCKDDVLKLIDASYTDTRFFVDIS